MDYVDVTPIADQSGRRRAAGLGDLLRLFVGRFQESADRALKGDWRPPIVFLRSFGVDEVSFGEASLGDAAKRPPIQQFLIWKSTGGVGYASEFEATIVSSVRGLGPVVAAARPAFSSPDHAELTRRYGEPVERSDRMGTTSLEWRVNGKRKAVMGVPSTPFGARRAHFRSDQWQAAVYDWLRRSQLVVVVMGETQGLSWELQQIMSLQVHDRLVVVVPPYWRAIASAKNNQPTDELREQFRQWQAY